MIVIKQVFGFMIWLAIIPSFGLRVSAAPSGCQKAVDAFISLPTKSTFAALVRSDKDACWSVVGPSNSTQDQLNHWAERGNRWAAQYLAEHMHQLDGGNLEDVLIALGQFSDHDMERLLLFSKNGLLSKRELTDSLTMLPLSLSDNSRAQLDMLSARKSKVMAVTRKDLLDRRLKL